MPSDVMPVAKQAKEATDIEMQRAPAPAGTPSTPARSGMSNSTILVLGALLGCAVTFGVTYPALKHQWDDAANPCAGKKPAKGGGFDNHKCVENAVEQAGGNVTLGYVGKYDLNGTVRNPVSSTLAKAGMCPVNVHWHLGAEHLSVGEYEPFVEGLSGGPSGPPHADYDKRKAAELPKRKLAGGTNYLGGRCFKYSALTDSQKKPYKWQYCKDMVVGETYEVHWPHSEMGACNTKYQYQTPFYDGVLCRLGEEAYPGKGKYGLGKVGDTADPLGLPGQIGVQGQVFTVVNDENYYYPDMMRGMVILPAADSPGSNGDMGMEVTAYTGSTTGTSRDNNVCSKYGPITWHVDRKCHLISASSFDKMCKDMLEQADDMSSDVHAHGAREVVSDELSTDNRKNLKSTNVYNDVQ